MFAVDPIARAAYFAVNLFHFYSLLRDHLNCSRLSRRDRSLNLKNCLTFDLKIRHCNEEKLKCALSLRTHLIDGIFGVPSELCNLLLRLSFDITHHSSILMRHRTTIGPSTMLQNRYRPFGLLNHAADARQHRVNVAPFLIATCYSRSASIDLAAGARTNAIPTRRRFRIN